MRRIEDVHRAPDFAPIGVEEQEGRSEFGAEGGRQLAPGRLLNVQPDDPQPVPELALDRVHDGPDAHAAESIGALEFEKHRTAGPEKAVNRCSLRLGAGAGAEEGVGECQAKA